MLSVRRETSVLALAVCAVVLTCLPAQAADTIGQASYGTNGTVCSYGGTMIQRTSPDAQYAAPYDGIITAWTSTGTFSSMTFKVARLGSGNLFTVIAADGPRAFSENVSATYPVRIAVRQGDVIGAYGAVQSHICASDARYSLGFQDADVPTGQTSLFTSNQSRDLDVEATIERDRDGDGFGDETQDACPTNGATQGPCPLPTTLGETFGPFSNTCHAPLTMVVAASPGVVSAAPHDGVITTWRHQGGLSHTVSGQIRLKTFRPLGGADYTVVGESQPQTAVAMTENTYPARVPVRQGDRIGVGVSGDQVSCGSGPAVTAHVSGFVGAEVPLGSSATFSLGNGRVDVSAALEADADGDGFGDTSQDLCPTDASTQADCPAGESQACESARKKLKKAKAKLKKLKRKDAATKKLKAAKKKVKKAKAKVEARC